MTPITKTVRISGGSANSIEDAISCVLGRAAETLKDITSFHLVAVDGTIGPSGAVDEYEVTLDIQFVVKEPSSHN